MLDSVPAPSLYFSGSKTKQQTSDLLHDKRMIKDRVPLTLGEGAQRVQMHVGKAERFWT